MTDPATLKPNAQILDEASAWFVEFADGDVAREIREAFCAWLKLSPEHVRAYLAVSATFDSLDRLDKHRSGGAQELIDRILAEGNVVALSDSNAADVRSKVSARNWRGALLAAAAAIGSIALALGTWQWWETGVYATGIGEQRVVNLADGSTLKLNAATRLRVRLSDQHRLVDLLEGQALFHVAKDPLRAFIVKSDTTRVRAVGTQFDVNRQGGETVVTVVEGRVAVAPTEEEQARPLFVSAGEQVILTAQGVSKRSHPDVAAATAWTGKKLVFASSPLPEVVGEYNRYHEKQLVIADPSLSDFKISGIFSAADATSLIAFLREQPNISLEETEREIVLRSK